MKTAMQELIKWMDDNKSHCTYGTIRSKATELLAKEKQQIIDAYFDGTAQFANEAEIVRPLKADDYFTQKYKQ